MSLSMLPGFTLHDGILTALRHGEGQTLVSRGYVVPASRWHSGGWGGNDKHMGKDQRLLRGSTAGLNLVIGIWQVYLQGVLDSPGPGMGEL